MRHVPPCRHGHTLIEVVVACTVFAAGVLALQRALLLVATHARDAHLQQLAAQAASSSHELAVGAPCGSGSTGVALERGVRVEWTAGPPLGAHGIRVQQRLVVPQSRGLREAVHTGAARCR